uniref:Uncharacterized protein n=1 Tax=Meloidogyne javanica TaxID=6303 RepID=A0A915MJ95_MELJA
MLLRFNFFLLAALCLAFNGIYGWGDDFFNNEGGVVNLDQFEANEQNRELEKKKGEEKNKENSEKVEAFNKVNKESDKKMEEVKMSESKKSIRGSKLAAMKYPKEHHEPLPEEHPEPLPEERPCSDKPSVPSEEKPIPEQPRRRTLTPELPLDGPIGEKLLPKRPELPSVAPSSQKPPLPHPVNNKYPADPLEIEDAPSSDKPPVPPFNNKYPSGPEDIDDEDSTSQKPLPKPLPAPAENKYPSPPKEIEDAPSSKKPLPAPIDNKYPSGPKIANSSSLPPPSPKPNGKKCNFIQKLLK